MQMETLWNVNLHKCKNQYSFNIQQCLIQMYINNTYQLEHQIKSVKTKYVSCINI